MRIGIDLGGTKIEGVALGADRAERSRRRIPTPRSYGGTLDAIAALVGELERDAKERGTVGIGIPGAIVRATGLVKNANSVWLIGQPLAKDLSTRLGCEVRVSNDANCFALSEAVDGAGAGARVVFGVILGTGVGGGIVLDGAVWEGPNLVAGEWGHNPLPWPQPSELPGPVCYCGKLGCIETWLSGPGFEAEFARVTGRALSSREIVGEAHAMKTEAVEALTRYRRRLSRALAPVVNVLDPDVIVLGGGMSNIGDLSESTKTGIAEWVFADANSTRIVQNVHGDSSGVRGAAWLWPEE